MAATNFRLSTLFACVLLIAAGCASDETAHRRALEPESPGTGATGTSLTPILEPELVGFRNSAQIDGLGLGTRARRLEMSDLQHVRVSTSGVIVLEVLAPIAIAGEMASQLSMEDTNETDSLFAAAREHVARIWSSISLGSVDSVRISFLAAPMPAGIWVYREERLDDGELHLLIANGVMREEPLQLWLMRAVDHAAHELLHVKQASLGFHSRTFAPELRVNKEAAAYLFGFCGQLGSSESLGASGGRLQLNEAEVRAVFPLIDQQLLCPDRRALRDLGGVGKQGERLSDGVLFHVFGGADAEFTDDGRRRLLALCRALEGDVPDMVNGDIPTIQAARACLQR